MTTRRSFLGTMAAAPGALARARRRPNFLILLTDDQRFDTIRALGNADVRTPNMDRLAARGVAFTQAATQGGLSGAICMPSRAQILTGRNVFEVHRDIVDRQKAPDPAAVTYPELLRGRGYETFHTGKWHIGPVVFQRSFGSGAEIFFGGMTDQSKVTVFDYSADGLYPKDRARTGAKYSSELFADAAVRFLERHDKAKPFVCSVAFTSPHDPRTAPERFAAMYPPDQMKVPANFLPQHPFDNGDLDVRDERLAGFPRTEQEVRRHLADYYAMVSEVDFQIGRILDALERSGEAGNTYIVFAGDNGLAVGQHGLMGKQNLYEHSVRVPLILSGPGIPRGKRNASLVHLMDIGPTVCELAGEKLVSATDGRNLAEAARRGARVPRDSAMLAYLGVQRGLRTGDWKLIEYNVKGVRTTQLFDLKNDPLEMKNLAEDAAQAGRVKAMRDKLAAQLRAAGDKADWVSAGQ